MIQVCDNCGLPSWAVSGEGVSITVEQKPENRYQRARKRTVWCHSEECPVQCLAVSKYGRASHKWPITLAQFRATQPLKQSESTAMSKRVRASRRAKDLVWGSAPMPTLKIDPGSNAESMA